MFEATSAWRFSYPEAHAGVLVLRSVTNPGSHPVLQLRKAALEERVRAQFAGQDRAAIAGHPVMQAYGE